MLEGEASEHIIQILRSVHGQKMTFKQEGQVSMPGVPDIYTEDINGPIWIEVKLVKAYPKRDNSKILKHDFDNFQTKFFKNTKSRSFALIADVAENKKIEFRILKKEDVKEKITFAEFKKLPKWDVKNKFWEEKNEQVQER